MRLLVPVALLLAASASAALAAGPGVSAPASPPVASPPGALPTVAAVCANCHGTDGRNQGAIPAIAGRPARLLGDKLRQFRVDSVSDATVMPRLVKGLSEAEIDQVAAYFAAVR